VGSGGGVGGGCWVGWWGVGRGVGLDARWGDGAPGRGGGLVFTGGAGTRVCRGGLGAGGAGGGPVQRRARALGVGKVVLVCSMCWGLSVVRRRVFSWWVSRSAGIRAVRVFWVVSGGGGGASFRGAGWRVCAF